MPPNELLDEFVARSLSRDPDARFSSATDMLEEWWRVVAALDRDRALPEIDVVFDDDEWENTLATSMARSRSAPSSAGPNSVTLQVQVPHLRPFDESEEAATDPQMIRPSEAAIRAAFDDPPPSER